MPKGFSVSATIEALQFLIPLTLCDKLVVKGMIAHPGVYHSS